MKHEVKFRAKRKMTNSQLTEVMKLQKKDEITNQQIADKFRVRHSTFLRYLAKLKN